MSYEIIYEKFITVCPLKVLDEQSRQFCLDRLGLDTTDMDNNAISNLIRTKYGLWISDDLYMLQMLVGSSNCWDTETNRRTRDWQFYGVGTHYELFKEYGCGLAADIEGGNIHPNGRWINAEGWLKSLRIAFKNAIDFQAMPYCSYMEFWLTKPTSWEEYGKLETFKTLTECIGVKVEDRKWFGEQKLKVNFKPESFFEMYLFQELTYKYLSKRWINTENPRWGLVKKQAI